MGFRSRRVESMVPAPVDSGNTALQRLYLVDQYPERTLLIGTHRVIRYACFGTPDRGIRPGFLEYRHDRRSLRPDQTHMAMQTLING